jgi:hypothetical protein
VTEVGAAWLQHCDVLPKTFEPSQLVSVIRVEQRDMYPIDHMDSLSDDTRTSDDTATSGTYLLTPGIRHVT